MKKLLVVVVFTIAQLGGVEAQEINWNQGTDWNQIKNEASKSAKLIFIDCYATWCGPCKQMDKEVYSNDSVADFFNQHFLSLKLQMDSTSRDNQSVKSMYSLVKEIGSMYKIEGYPTLLFFSPEGILLNRELGFKKSSELIKVASGAFSPEALAFYKKIDRYKAGEREYAIMKDLAGFARNVLNDRILAKQIAHDYVNHANHKELMNISSIYFVRDVAGDYKKSVELAKEFKDYLLSFSSESLVNDSVLRFMSNYLKIIKTSDGLFQFLITDSIRIDGVMKFKGWTKTLIGRIISNEELYNRLVQDGKPVLAADPDWEGLKSVVASKYPFVNANKIILDFQIDYYRSVALDWQKWATYKQIRIDKYPPNANDDLEITIELNDYGAWDAFLNCNDKNVLKNAIPWIDLAIKLSKTARPEDFPGAYVDTKANLLYKIGRVSEAIKTEREIIRQLKILYPGNERVEESIREYTKVLENMKQGKPTYKEQGAKWDNYTLPKKQDAQISTSKQ